MLDVSWLERLQLLVGAGGIEALQKSKVAVFGIGGVGSWAAEALARSGVGQLVLIDADDIQTSNINRQIMATTSTVGYAKVEIMQARIADIAPQCKVVAQKIYYDGENLADLELADASYIIDAIDSVKSKVALLKSAYKDGITIFSSMGAGNKCQPQKMQVADISKTHTCPLARIVRRELGKCGIKSGIKTVFSTEPALVLQGLEKCKAEPEQQFHCGVQPLVKPKRIGSLMTVTATAGLLLAQCVLDEIIFSKKRSEE